MVSPSGRSVVISAGEYEAETVEIGGALRALRRSGHDVIAGYPAEQMASGGRGQVLIPWPNRIEDGAYTFNGATLQLPLSEPARHNASHGLVRWVSWELVERAESSARWAYRLRPQPGYPFLLDVSASYAVAADGLHVELTATNVGDQPTPYGAGQHPYLTVGRRIDECELTLPAAAVSTADERGLPGPAEPVADGPLDFRRPRVVGDTVLDHTFSELAYPTGDATAVLRDPASVEATLTVQESTRWLQVFTGDGLPSGARESIAVEPMTCPPNAYRSGIDLVTLGPGQSHTLAFTIS